MKRYYHYIVEDKFTGERKEIIKRGNLTNSSRYKVVACCGYHEKELNKN